MGWLDRKFRKSQKRNKQLAETADSATKAIKSISGTVTEATKAAANIKTGGASGAAEDALNQAEDALNQITKQGPVNPVRRAYDNPAFVGQADLNSHILESFSKGIMEEEEKKKKEEQGEEPVNKRGYLRKQYRGKSDPYKGFQKKGLLNKVENGDEDKRNILIDQMAASRLNTDSSAEDIQREKSEAKEFLDEVAHLNPTKGYTSESTPRVFDLDETNLPKKEGDVFDYSDRKGEKGKYSKQGKKWLRQSNKLVR